LPTRVVASVAIAEVGKPHTRMECGDMSLLVMTIKISSIEAGGGLAAIAISRL